ncbi:MAG: NAD(P)/FAD-dependent oxidoreductase [Gemmatimonadetes bacterium]|jgi:phytoene dehydrogenase-like protein|nr:NAD(P)/FAD-dependent oxidoreductase [Gemmatimonadota bacterium]
MSEKRYDAVVIGAGLSGLSAGAFLARAGKKVLLLEHHAIPGGYAHSFERGKFWFEVSLHAVCGLAPGGDLRQALSELGVYDRLQFDHIDPFYVARYPEHEVTVAADFSSYRTELAGKFPAEKEQIDNLFRDIERFDDDVRRFKEGMRQGRKFSQEEMAAEFPHMAGAFPQTWAAYLESRIQDRKLRGILSILWGYLGLPSSQVSAALFLFLITGYNMGGAYYPAGGSMAVSRAIEAEIHRCGQEILYNQTASKIHLRDGKVAGVTTQQGLTVECDLVVSSMNVPDTILQLIGPEHFDPAYVERIEQRKLSVSSFILFLGIDRELLEEDWPHHEYFLCETYDVEEAYEYVREGRFDKTDLAITYYSAPEGNERTPENYTSLAIMTLASADYADGWGTGGEYAGYRRNRRYREIKEEVGEILLTRVEKLIPGLHQAIVHKNTATPITNFRYTLNPGGSIYGFEQDVRNFTDRLQPTTPVANLFLSGMWIAGGGIGSAICSGKNVGDMAVGYLEGV